MRQLNENKENPNSLKEYDLVCVGAPTEFLQFIQKDKEFPRQVVCQIVVKDELGKPDMQFSP